MVKKLTVKLASGSGFCFGVKKALRVAEDAAENYQGRIYTYGAIIHNPQVVAQLEERGVAEISSLRSLRRGDVLIISAHGSAPDVSQKARAKGALVIDATCPFVARGHDFVSLLYKKGYEIIIIGDRDHREVAGLLACSAGHGKVVTSGKEVKRRLKKSRVRKIGVVCQTTQRTELLLEVTAILLPKAQELRVFNTICDATQRRQDSTRKLAGCVDVMLVVGGRNSANTQRLLEICREECRRSHLIEVADEIKASWLGNAVKLGIAGGASTPRGLIDGVIKKIHSMERNLEFRSKKLK